MTIDSQLLEEKIYKCNSDHLLHNISTDRDVLTLVNFIPETYPDENGCINIQLIAKKTNVFLEDDIFKANISYENDSVLLDKSVSSLINLISFNKKEKFVEELFNLKKQIRPELILEAEKSSKGFWSWLKNILTKKKVLKEESYLESYSESIRKILTKINLASNIIATNGRLGPANTIITNEKFGNILKDFPGFVINTSLENNDVYLKYIGHISGMRVYVNSNMSYSDNRVLVGRFDVSENGVKLYYNPNKLNISTINLPDGQKNINIRTFDKLFFPPNFDNQIEICQFNINF